MECRGHFCVVFGIVCQNVCQNRVMKEKRMDFEKKKPSIFPEKSRTSALVYPAGFEPVAFRVGV